MCQIILYKDKPKYRKYYIHCTYIDKNDKVYNVCGYIVFEKYDMWNLELMQVSPTGKGFGTILLKYVMKDMRCDITVCPTSDESKKFFIKHGMDNENIIHYKVI